MKSLFIKSFAALAGLAMLFWTLSCGTSAPNNDQSGVSSSALADPCAAANSTNRISELQTRIESEVNNDKELANQRRAKKFDFRVRQGNVNGDYAEVVWAGTVRGEKKFEKISDILDDFQKKGCIQRILMVANVDDVARPNVVGFEWSFCEEGLCPGPGGSCVRCTLVPVGNQTPTPNVTNETNPSGNSNSGGGNSNR